MTASVQENQGTQSKRLARAPVSGKTRRRRKSEEKEQGRDAFLEFTPDLAVKPKSWLGHRSRSSDTNCNQSSRHPAMFWGVQRNILRKAATCVDHAEAGQASSRCLPVHHGSKRGPTLAGPDPGRETAALQPDPEAPRLQSKFASPGHVVT